MQDKTNKSYKMKKISTMFLGLVLTAAVFAADKRPDVTIISAKKYEIVIDRKTYFSNNRMMSIDNLRNGRHTIQVFEMKLGGFSIFKRKQLVTSKAFQLRNNDVRITIDRFGHLTITEDRFGRDNRYDDRDNKYDKDQKDWDDHDHNGKYNRGSRF
jgi:hypothetical protein